MSLGSEILAGATFITAFLERGQDRLVASGEIIFARKDATVSNSQAAGSGFLSDTDGCASFFVFSRQGLEPRENQIHLGAHLRDQLLIDLNSQPISFVGIAVLDSVLNHGAGIGPDADDDPAEVCGVGGLL